MPTYCYKCQDCQKEQEIVQKITDSALTHCPFCKKESFKRVPPKEVAIQFKGSGFYKNDYTAENKSCGNSCSCH